jgi:hypothetical protein
MAYYLVEDFRGGIDLRRTAVSTKPGALRDITNGFVTVGGEIEQRRRFDLQYVLPAGTVGVIGVGGEIWVHGLAASVAVTLPFVYKQLVPNPALAGGVTITRILDADLFNRNLYLIVSFSDGSVRHFYNGIQITSPDVVGARKAETHKDKVYVITNNILQFSAVGLPADWTGTGSGFIDITSRDFGSADAIGLETYYNDLAIFGLRSIQIWQMDQDPAKNQIVQVIGGLGVIGGNAHVRYGNGDILFLADTGIRSLKARDSSGAATQGDIGTPIDDLVKEMRRSLVPGDLEKLQGLVDPGDGTIWFVWRNKALVLAYYPVSDVTAWSRFDFGFTAEYATVCGNRVFLRDAGNNVYSYGAKAAMGVRIDPTTSGLGPGAAEYDGAQMTVVTPMFDFGHPGHFKTFTGLDLACDGVIHVDVNYDPNPRNVVWNQVVTVHDNTFGQGRVPLEGYSTHIGLRFRSTQGFSRIGAICIHYEQADAE